MIVCFYSKYHLYFYSEFISVSIVYYGRGGKIDEPFMTNNGY